MSKRYIFENIVLNQIEVVWPKGVQYFWSIRNPYTLFNHILSGNESTIFTKLAIGISSMGEKMSSFTNFEGRIVNSIWMKTKKFMIF